MNIPINADLYCQGDLCGATEAVVLNPITEQITHIVVKEKDAPHTERLIPINLIETADEDAVRLTIPGNELYLQEPFIEVKYLRNPIPHYMPSGNETYYARPFVLPMEEVTVVKHRSIPPHELAISRGAKVYSADKHKVGRVDEFIVEKETGNITQLILREGHLFSTEDVSIPVSEIEGINEDDVHLKLTRKEIAALPPFQLNGGGNKKDAEVYRP